MSFVTTDNNEKMPTGGVIQAKRMRRSQIGSITNSSNEIAQEIKF